MALAVLNNTTKKLQVKLAGAVNTSECPVNAAYFDFRRDGIGGNEANRVYGSADSITTGGTAVDLVSAPGTGTNRVITDFSLYNDDVTTVTVTVQLYVNATTTRILWYGTLQTNECLFYNEARGWYATDANANQKSNASSTSGATSEALSTATQASSMASSVVANGSPYSASSQASSLAAGIVVASVNSVSSQASSMAALTPASISSQASSIVALSPASISSQASSIVALSPASISAYQSGASAQSFTSTNWSTISSAVSKLKSSFTW